jgi:hypothetical protein
LSFLSWAALAVGLLVVAPLVAHLLRRRPPDEEAFAATRLVPARTAVAQRRTAIEDRALFAIRAAAVLLLALLGATPLLKCSRLSLAREGGASVAIAILLDDSMSMQANLEPGDETTRFARAKRAALELCEGLQPGDAVSVLYAGSPPRVALAATTNLDAVRETIEKSEPTDRGTDLDGAIKLAAELLSDMQHVDKRVVVLSDLADGTPDAGVLVPPADVKLWIPLAELRGPRFDCGVESADRHGVRVTVHVACTPGYAAGAEAAGVATDRRVEIRAGDKVLAEEKLRLDDKSELLLHLPESADDIETIRLWAAITGKDAIGSDDAAPVVSAGGQLHAGVLSDPATSRPPTGGPPTVEQVFAALDLGVQVRPLSTIPERAEELDGVALLVMDDPPGFTPGQRRDLAAWIEKGGVALVTLGPNAAHAPLGSGFSPLVEGLVRWSKDAPAGIDEKNDTFFAEAAVGLGALEPKGRALLDMENDTGAHVLSKWQDGAPFLLEHRLGRGVAYALTLPFDTEVSDFPVRLGFLHLIGRVVDTARTLGGTARTPVGQAWSFDGFDSVAVKRLGASDITTPIEVTASPNGRSRRVAVDRIGLYELSLDDSTTTRVAGLVDREVDTRPRALDAEHEGKSLGGVEASVDVSHYVAIGLLLLLLVEIALRVWSPRTRAAAAGSDEGEPPTSQEQPPVEKDAA